MPRSYKVLHYLYNFSLGSETFVYDLIKSLNRTGHKNYVLTNRRSLKKERPMRRVFSINDNGFYLKRIIRKLGLISNYIFLDFRQVDKIIDEVKPDIIHAHFGPNGLIMYDYLIKSNSNIPLVISFHGTDVLSLPWNNKNYYRLLMRMLKSGNCYNVTCTKFLKQKLIELGVSKDNVFITNNSCQFPVIKKYRTSSIRLSEKKVVVLSVGRLIKWKGHKYLLEGFSLFNKQHNNSELIIVGEGAEKSYLVKLASTLGISDNVRFLGYIPHKSIVDIMKYSDIFIQPSIVDTETKQCESFGLTVLEAINAGLPVIVTNTGGLPELIGSESNCYKIVREKDPVSISHAILDIVNSNINVNSLLSNASRISARFSVVKQINSIVSIYNTAFVRKG